MKEKGKFGKGLGIIFFWNISYIKEICWLARLKRGRKLDYGGF